MAAIRRFEHIHPSTGPLAWTGGFMTEPEAGGMAYRFSESYPFKMDGVATFDSNISQP